MLIIYYPDRLGAGNFALLAWLFNPVSLDQLARFKVTLVNEFLAKPT